jgi:hypothetical protein
MFSSQKGSNHGRRDGTRNHRTDWQRIGTAYFLKAFSDLYWEGVRRDIREILKTLREWTECGGLDHLDDIGEPFNSSEASGFGTFVKRATGDSEM